MTSDDTIKAVQADDSLTPKAEDGSAKGDGSINTDLIQINLLMQIRDLLKGK